jgi:DNA polymerase-3 subunit beta
VILASDKQHVTVKCGGFKSRLQAMPVDDFPRPEPVEGLSSTIDGAALRQLIARTRYAINATASKHIMQGALLTLAGPTAAMVATDGHRLALATMSRTGADVRVIIPMKTLDVLSGSADIGQLEFTIGEQRLFFQSGERLLVSRTIDSQFPAYERIIPRDSNKKAVIERATLSAAIKRVGLVSEQNQAAYFDFAEGSVDISAASAEVGSADERVPIGYTGEPLKVCCSWRYLLDFLDAASGQIVTLELKDDKRPILLTDGDDHIAVIMLMRA